MRSWLLYVQMRCVNARTFSVYDFFCLARLKIRILLSLTHQIFVSVSEAISSLQLELLYRNAIHLKKASNLLVWHAIEIRTID